LGIIQYQAGLGKIGQLYSRLYCPLLPDQGSF